jgi:hypothetical protein
MASIARKPSKPWPILLILAGQLDIHLMKVGMKFQLNISKNGHFMTDFPLKMAIFGVYLISGPLKITNQPDIWCAPSVVLVHPHKKFELNCPKMTELWPIFVQKLRFFTVHCISNFVRSSSFFLWSCSRPVGIPTGNFSSIGRWERWKNGNFLGFGTGFGQF